MQFSIRHLLVIGTCAWPWLGAGAAAPAWVRQPMPLHQFTAFAASEGHQFASYLADGTSLLRNEGIGKFEVIHHGAYFLNLTAHPLDSNVVLGLASATPAIDGSAHWVRSADGGRHWSPLVLPADMQIVPKGLDRRATEPFWFVAKDDARVYAEARRADGKPALLVSTDGGQHWRDARLPVQDGERLHAFDVAPDQGDRLYAVTGGLGTDGAPCACHGYVSTDAGETWMPLPLDAAWSAERPPTMLLALPENRIGLGFRPTRGNYQERFVLYDAASGRVESEQNLPVQYASVVPVKPNHVVLTTLAWESRGWTVDRYQMIYYSTDGGRTFIRTWYGKANEGVYRPHPADPRRLLAFAQETVGGQAKWVARTSEDAGQNWRSVQLPPAMWSAGGESQILPGPGSAWRVLEAARSSADGMQVGRRFEQLDPTYANWRQPDFPPTADGASVTALQFEGGSLYAGSLGVLWRRSGTREDWQALSWFSPRAETGFVVRDNQIAFSSWVPESPSMGYAELRHSGDGGATFHLVAPAVASPKWTSLAFDFSRPANLLYTDDRNGVFRGLYQVAPVHADEWTGGSPPPNPRPVQLLAPLVTPEEVTPAALVLTDRRRPERVLAMSGRVVYRSNDAGASWAATLGTAADAARLTALHVSLGDPQQVWATTGDAILRSTDGGAVWSWLSAFGAVDSPRAVLADPQQPDRVWVGTNSGVLVSRDGGKTWATAAPQLPKAQVHVLAWTPEGIYAATARGLFLCTACVAAR